MTNPLLTKTRYEITPAGIISKDHQRIAEIISDYNPELSLAWIPTADRSEGEKPYCVVHTMVDGSRYPVMFLDEAQLDHRVIAELYMRDMSHAVNADPISWAEAQELAYKTMLAKKEEDEAAERADLAKSILKSKLNTYKHNGKKYRS